MTTANRLYFLLIIIVVFLVKSNLADTKVLYNLLIETPLSFRNETAILKNVGTPDQELVVTGTISITFAIPNNDGEAFRDTTTYIADKNGYRVKHKLITIPIVDTRIGAMALKSSVG